MGKTAIDDTLHDLNAETPGPEAAPSSTVGQRLWQTLAYLASLRLTVTLFWLAFVLVFLGTVAMKDEGIWTIVSKCFRTYVAWIPYQVFVRFGQVFFGVSEQVSWPGSFPFPGGWLIGSALMVNLLAAHAVRFKLTWKRSGILMLHAGLAIMFVGEWLTGTYAVEGNMAIEEGNSANYVVHNRTTELAVIDSSDAQVDRVVAVP